MVSGKSPSLDDAEIAGQVARIQQAIVNVDLAISLVTTRGGNA